MAELKTLRKFLLDDYKVRIALVDTTELINEVALNATTSALGTVVIGRAVTGVLLLACQTKPGHRVCLHFKGDGVLGDVYAEAEFEGGCRGYLEKPQADLTADLSGFGDGIGRGQLIVTRQSKGQQRPHVSSTAIQTGEVGDDLAYYLHQSQQVRSIVNLGTKLNDVGRVDAAGGMLIEIMQDVPEDFIDELEERCKLAPAVTDLISQNISLTELLTAYFAHYRWHEIDHECRPRISCTCSRTRIMRSLKLLGPEEINDAIAVGKELEIRCQFCGRDYVVTIPQLKLLASLPSA